MHLILLTARIMLRRAAGNRGVVWACGMPVLCLLLIAPAQALPGKMSTLLAMLPSVFLLTGWYDSESRNGLTSLVFRSGGSKLISIAEIALPALAGAVLGSLFSLATGTQPPWQFWVVIILFSASFTFLFALTESQFQYPGRFLLTGLWILGVRSATLSEGPVDLLVFTEYPFAVLTTAPEAGGFHPDTFVLSSMLLLVVSALVFIFLVRRER